MENCRYTFDELKSAPQEKARVSLYKGTVLNCVLERYSPTGNNTRLVPTLKVPAYIILVTTALLD
jgi:hypothetical protein